MSYVEEFIEEGKEIGEEIGVYKEKKRRAIFFYQKKMTLQTIAEYVDLPMEEVKKIIAEYVENRQSN